jgi:hypothetical protein
MTQTIYDFEGGTNGANVATGGGITAVSPGPPEYSNTADFQGSLGITAVGTQWAKWASPNPAGDHSGSVYIRADGNPGTGSQRVIIWDNAGTGDGGAFAFHSNGKMRLVNGSNVLQGAESTTTWANGDEFRIDYQYNDVAGSCAMSLRIFKNANIDGSTPDETLSRTLTSCVCNNVRLGGLTTGTWDFDFDNFVLSDILEWIGPFVPDTPLTTPVLTEVSKTAASSAGASDGTATYSWPPVTLADHYAIAIAGGLGQTSGFSIVDSNVTSPHTLTGLAAGDYTVAVRAVP